MPRQRRQLLPDLGERIREARNALGLSQQQLAGLIGKTASAISKYERGQINEVQVLLSLSEALGKHMEWLLYGHRSRPAEQTAANMERADPTPSVLQFDVLPKRVRNLPPRHRARYLQRAKEVMERAQRELEEYTKVLEAGRRAGRAKPGRKS